MDAKSLSRAVMLELNHLRLSSHLCDAFIFISQPEAVQIPVHACVLSACSTYFKERILAHQTKQSRHVFGIQGIEAYNMVQVLDFMYTGQIMIQNERDAKIYENIASNLKISLLLDYCKKYLRGDVENELRKRNRNDKLATMYIGSTSESNMPLIRVDASSQTVTEQDVKVNVDISTQTGVLPSTTQFFHNYCTKNLPAEEGKNSENDPATNLSAGPEDVEDDTEPDPNTYPQTEVTPEVVDGSLEPTMYPVDDDDDNSFLIHQPEDGRIFMVTMKSQSKPTHTYACAATGKTMVFDKKNETGTSSIVPGPSIFPSSEHETFTGENLFSLSAPNAEWSGASLMQTDFQQPAETSNVNSNLPPNLLSTTCSVIKGLVEVASTSRSKFPEKFMAVPMLQPKPPVEPVQPVVVSSKPKRKRKPKPRKPRKNLLLLPHLRQEQNVTELLIDTAVKCEEADSDENKPYDPLPDIYRTTTDSGKYQCEICQRSVQKKWNLFKHLQRKHPHVLPTCQYCGKQSTSMRRNDAHMILYCEKNKVDDKYRCHGEDCSYKAETPREVMKHYKDLHVEKCTSFVCSICEEEFSKQMYYHEHILNDHNITDLAYLKPKTKFTSCSQCSFKSTFRYRVIVHEEAVHSGVVNRCDECNTTFKCQAYLRKHIEAVHEKKQLYKCSMCSLTSAYIETIKSHQYTEHKMLAFPGQKLYKCSQCNFTHVKRCKVKLHESEKHSTTVYPCQFCDKVFTRKSFRRRHQLVHSNVRKHECHLCDFKTKSRALLKMHWRCRHSEERPYVCDGCGHATKVKANLNKHMKICELRRTLKMLDENIVGIDDLQPVEQQLGDFMQ